MQTYLVQAQNLYDSIPIKRMRSVLSGTVLDSTPTELQLQYGEHSFLFLFRFGCLVSINLDRELLESEKNKIAAAVGQGLTNPTTESYQIHIGAPENRVEFEFVEIKNLSLKALRIIALTLGQSAALEYFEIDANRILTETMDVMQKVARKGSTPMASKKLLKVIGYAASNRQHIISNLAVLDPPDETWLSKDLENLFNDLQKNFDIGTRFRTLDRKLSLVQDNIEILVNLVTARRAAFLEFLIVILIIMELIVTIGKQL